MDQAKSGRILRARMKFTLRVSVVCLAMLLSASCLVRRRLVAPAGKPPNRPMMTATREELLERVHAVSDPIHSFLARTDMTVSVGSLYLGEVTDYATITGYVLFQRPDDIRVLGQDPVVESTVFDMVSRGEEFRVSIPRRNRFVVGNNEAPGTSKNKLENLRPSAFLDALMIYPPDPQGEVALLEDNTDENLAEYVLLIIRRDGDQLRLARSIYFDRYTLQVIRQKIFDPAGNILSEARYSVWKDFAGQAFPTDIDLKRPQDGYEVHLGILTVKINTSEVTPDRFVLEQPPGSELQVLK